MELAVIAVACGIWTGMIGRAKGGSFLLWFLIGTPLLLLGPVVAILFRRERDEPEGTCPRCGARQKLYVQVCTRCGMDLYFSEAAETPGGDAAPAGRR